MAGSSAATAAMAEYATSMLEVRIMYVRFYPCIIDATPPRIMLSHFCRETADVELNGHRFPVDKRMFIPLYRGPVDRDAAGVIYVSTSVVRFASEFDFLIFVVGENLLLRGSLKKSEILSDGSYGGVWSLNCALSGRIGRSRFLQPMATVEVYIAGHLASVPVILAENLFFGGSVPTSGSGENSNRPPALQVTEEEIGYYLHDRYIDSERYSREDWRMTWFNAALKVCIGLGLYFLAGFGAGAALTIRRDQSSNKSSSSDRSNV